MTITALLHKWRSGDEEAGSQLMDLVYAELHRIAASQMNRQRGAHTLQTTAVLHEAYLRLRRSESIDWQDSRHFYAIATLQLRRVLIDHARRAQSERRGGSYEMVALLDSDSGVVSLDDRLLALDEALTKLASLDRRAARVVELRFFGGLTEMEAAETLDISVATLKRDWNFAKTWLTNQFS